MKLTDNILRSLGAPKERFDLPDEGSKGLVARIAATGAITWAFRYRFQGKRKRFAIGVYRQKGSKEVQIPLAKARREAMELAAMVARGIDPKNPEPIGDDAPETFEELADRWLEERASANRSAREQGYHVRNLPKGWKALEPRAITRGHVKDLRAKLARARGNPMANRMISTVSSVLTFAEDFEWIPRNPCHGLKKLREDPRKRPLEFDEIRELWQACEAHDVAASRAIRLLLLTGQRRDEILHAHNDEIEDGWLHLPGSRTKNKKPHRVFLTDTALELLEDLPETGYLFPHRRDPARPQVDIKTSKATIVRKAGIPDWQVRDLRTTFATQGIRVGIPPLSISLCLNHTFQSSAGAAADITNRHYVDRAAYEQTMKEAWIQWDTFLRGLLSGGGEKVVSIAS